LQLLFFLDQSFLLFAGKTTVAFEALALAFAIVKAAVGAGGELREVAQVIVVVHFSNSHSSSGRTFG